MNIVEKMARAMFENTPVYKDSTRERRWEWADFPCDNIDPRRYLFEQARAALTATGLTEAQLEGLANGTMVVRSAHKAPIGDGDWFWRQMDPDDSGDSIHEALRHVPDFVVCHMGASYSAGDFFAARVPTLSDDDDDTEELIAETEQECIRLVAERRAMLAAKEG